MKETTKAEPTYTTETEKPKSESTSNTNDGFSYDDFVRFFTEGDFSLVDPDFKAEMDAYEAIYDEYFNMMKKMMDGDYDFFSMFETCDAMISRWEECEEKMEAVDESKLSPADDAYFLYINARILKKDLELLSGGIVSKNNEDTERKERENTGDTNKVKVGIWCADVPTYWVKSSKFDRYLAYAETGRSCAMLTMSSSFDANDPVGFYWLEDESETKAIIENYKKGLEKDAEIGDFEVVSKEVIQTTEIKGLLWNIHYKINGHPCTNLMFMYPSEKDNNWVLFQCLFTDNSRYLYNNDFRAILESLKQEG